VTSGWGYVLETGNVALTGPAQQLLRDDRVQAVYFGL
jgi:ABC-type branched-subunit amino acid transport system ATPase component